MSTARAPNETRNEHRLRSLTIRLDPETYEKLIAIAGEKSKAEYIRAVLVAHLSAPQGIAGAPQANLEAKIESLEELIRAKNETIRILEEDKGFLTQDHVRISGQLERLLMPSSQEIEKRQWWHFWKK